jgi:hypothetical protein
VAFACCCCRRNLQWLSSVRQRRNVVLWHRIMKCGLCSHAGIQQIIARGGSFHSIVCNTSRVLQVRIAETPVRRKRYVIAPLSLPNGGPSCFPEACNTLVKVLERCEGALRSTGADQPVACLTYGFVSCPSRKLSADVTRIKNRHCSEHHTCIGNVKKECMTSLSSRFVTLGAL